MDVNVDIKYTLDDIIAELGQDDPSHPVDDILVIQMKDKFFNGGGCEYNSAQAMAFKKLGIRPNISICANGTV